MDIENIKLKEANKYHSLAINILKGIVNDFLECNEYKEMKKNEEISIFAGEYMDEADIIYETSKE